MARVLVIEDNQNLAEGLRTNLEFEGHEVELRADGSYQGSDGCNASMGRWVSGPDGAVLATSGAMTLVGCHNLYVTGYLVDAHAAGFVDGVLVLVADDGTETGRLRRAE